MDSNPPTHSYLQRTPGENHSANFFCQLNFLASHQPVEQWASTGDSVYTLPRPNLPALSSLIVHTTTPLVTPMSKRWRCPICPESFPRRQERDRHELSHVPYFMHCPLPHCAWRGNRAGLFKKHWQKEDHRSYHEHYGRTPGQSQIQTFDPWMILTQIINGAISFREGEVRAIFLVQAKACALNKPSMWMDPWGRNKMRLMEQHTQPFRLKRPIFP